MAGMSKKQQLPLLAQIISVSDVLNRDEKLALVKYLMLDLNEPVFTTADVKVIVNQEMQKQANNAEMARQIRQLTR